MHFEKKHPRKLICVTKQKPDQKQTLKAENVPAPVEKCRKRGRVQGRVWELQGLSRWAAHQVSHLPLPVTVGHCRVWPLQMYIKHCRSSPLLRASVAWNWRWPHSWQKVCGAFCLHLFVYRHCLVCCLFLNYCPLHFLHFTCTAVKSLFFFFLINMETWWVEKKILPCQFCSSYSCWDCI